MCRWAAYIGEPVFLETLVTAPCHSLIEQSHHALEAKTPTNGDGFGVAWYGERGEPGLYRDILPAWSDPNLKSLCRQIRSPLFLAHVRASTGGATGTVGAAATSSAGFLGCGAGHSCQCGRGLRE